MWCRQARRNGGIPLTKSTLIFRDPLSSRPTRIDDGILGNKSVLALEMLCLEVYTNITFIDQKPAGDHFTQIYPAVDL